MKNRVIVIGGGIAGLATAGLLAREGYQVRLLEKNEQVGGRAGSVEREGFRFDTGPSWYLMPRVFEHFFTLMGTSVDQVLDLKTLDPGYRVFSESAGQHTADSITVPYGKLRVANLFEQIEPGSGSKLHKYLDSAAHTSKMAEQYFLYNPFTSIRSLLKPEVLKAIPRLATLLTKPLHSFISKQFKNPILRQILGYPAVFLGTDPRTAPSMYHLMSALDLDEGVRYPTGGFWQLVQQIETVVRGAGVEIVTGAEVTEILTRKEGNATVVSGVRWADQAGLSHIEHAHQVVSAADLHHTETKLLPVSLRSYPESWWKKQESGPGAVIALLGVKGALPDLPHHSLFFTKDWDKNFDAIFGKSQSIPDPASLYVCKPSANDASVAPKGHENLFVLIPVPADVSIGSGSAYGLTNEVVEATVDAAIDQIASWADIEDLRERIVVRETIGPEDFAKQYYSWSGGMLGQSHILSQSAMFRPQNQSKRVTGLFYAGATTAPGVGVPMCLISAELVLKRMRGDQSAGPLPENTFAGSVVGATDLHPAAVNLETHQGAS